ncbi:MAG: hypothetical protein ACR2NS_10450 [Gemmatimonadaceae bacterium]
MQLTGLVMAGMLIVLNCDREDAGSKAQETVVHSPAHNSTSLSSGGIPSPLASERRDAGFDSILPPNMREALYSLAPDFRPYRRDQFGPEFARADSASGPYGLSVVRAHLNADSVPDVALLGYGRSLSYFLAFLSQPDGTYLAMHVEPPTPLEAKDTARRGISLERIPRGRIDLYVETEFGRYVNLRSDGVILNIGSEGALIFFLKDGKFASVAYGD